MQAAVSHRGPLRPARDVRRQAGLRGGGGRRRRAGPARPPPLALRCAGRHVDPSAALSFFDGELIPSAAGRLPRRDGGLADARQPALPSAQARVGLAVVVASAAIIVYNDPRPRRRRVRLHPGAVRASSGWSASPCRSGPSGPRPPRSAPRRAERDREAAARVAVAEERARIARELHDVVAHAMSVMVLQVGAVRHRMPRRDAERAGGAAERRAGRPDRARRDAPAARRHARTTGTSVELAPHPGLGELGALVEDVRAPGWTSSSRSTASPSSCRPASTSRPTASCRRD